MFVQVALTQGIASEIGHILAQDTTRPPPEDATAAMFYSISSTQEGLRGSP